MVSFTTMDNNEDKILEGRIKFEMQVEMSRRQLDVQLFYIHSFKDILESSAYI